MVDRVLAPALPAVVGGLDAQAAGVEEEGAEVGVVVFGPGAGLPVASVTRLDARAPERVDLFSRAGDALEGIDPETTATGSMAGRRNLFMHSIR